MCIPGDGSSFFLEVMRNSFSDRRIPFENDDPFIFAEYEHVYTCNSTLTRSACNEQVFMWFVDL